MKKHILCIGDSNTHGLCTDPSESADHGSRYNEEERWTCLLQKALGAEYLVIEEGLSGRTCVYDDPDMDSVNLLPVLHALLNSHEPLDLLILMLGTNDSKVKFNTDARKIAKGMQILLEEAKSVPCWGKNGPKILSSLLTVLLVAYGGYIIHAAVVYSSTVKVLAGISPVQFFKGMAPAMMMAFSSASSVGALPFNMECTERLGARREVSSFVLPLGATINMDGTAIYQGVCSVFIASCFGVYLTLGNMVTIVLTATLASIGTAGVPGAGMVMLAMVLQSVNIPVEGIALVAGIDRIFDMGRTTINITGDAACAVVVSKMEDRKVARTKSVLG